MAGKRKVNTSRKVTTSSKSIKIVARNTSARSDNIGSNIQLRNRNIVITDTQSINYTPSNKRKKLCGDSKVNIILNPDIRSFETNSSDYFTRMPDYPEESLDYEPEDEVEHFKAPYNYCDNMVYKSFNPDKVTNFLAENLNEMSSRASVTASVTHTESDRCDNSQMSYQNELLPYNRQLDFAEDHRQDNYILLKPTEYKKKFVDSSSCSSDSNTSIPKSTTENFPLTAEEEDKLLESDDDEDDNDDIKSEQSFDSNDTRPPFKHTDIVMDGINIVVNKTFPKWNRKCVPSERLQQPITLNDLGYTSVNENDCGDSDSVCSKSTTYEPLQELSSFKVTLSSNQQRICEQVDNLNKNFSFKKPILPPIKRPPTRPKRLGSDNNSSHSASSSVSDVSESRMRYNLTTFDNDRTFSSSQKEDDVISLSASTIMDPDITFDRDSIKTEVMSDIDIAAGEGDGTNNFSHNNVENWLAVQNSNSVKNVDKNDSVPSLTIIPGINGPRVHFKAVPAFFNGICYRYFFNEDCSLIKCKTSHYINKQVFTKKCRTHIKSSTEMQTIYDFSLRFHKLIPQIYPCLLKGFAYFKMQNSLFACIDDFFALKHIIDCQDAVERIIEAFEDTGLTFSEVIDKLSINIGFERHKKLAEILLDLLTERPNVSEYWEQIKRITLAVKFIHPKMLNRLLFKFLNQLPLNKELGKDIYIVIIKNNFTDLSSVSSELLTSITTMFQFGDNSLANSIAYNLSKEHEKFEQSRLQNQNAQDFTNSNEKLSQFETTNKGNQLKSSSSMDSTDRLNIQFDTKSNGKRRVKPSRFTDRLNIQVENGRNTCQQLECSSSRSTSSQYSNNSRELSPIPIIPYIPSAIIPQNMVQFSDTIQQQPQTTPITSTQLTTSLPQRIIHNNNVSSYPAKNLFCFSSPVSQKTMQNVDISCPNEYNLCPDVPILGKFNYGKDFNFNTSLHHLLPTAADQVPLNNSDIKTLHEAIENRNGEVFLHLFNKNKGPATVQSFVSMSIVNFKNCIGEYNALVDLIENIEMVQPEFKKDPLLKGVIEVIVFNLLFLFERKCQFDDARKLIETFCDWDSLISSKIFGMYKYTPMGRYLLLAKLLAKANGYYKVYDILECDNLRLLKSQSEWPLHSSLRSDLELRNAVLADFFTSAYRQNVGAELIFEFYKNIFQSEEIWEFDACIYFNPMLEYMLDNERTLGLKRCLANIDVFYKYMDKNILRGFLVYTTNYINNPEKKYELFEFGIKKGVYSNITGLESTLIVKNDIIDCELMLILGYYLNKLRSQNLINNLKIQITFVKEVVKSPSILVNRVRSLSDVKRSIINSLLNLGIHLPNVENKNCTEVEIDKNILKHFLRNISLNK